MSPLLYKHVRDFDHLHCPCVYIMYKQKVICILSVLGAGQKKHFDNIILSVAYLIVGNHKTHPVLLSDCASGMSYLGN